MNINLICIGKLKERYWREAVEEYSRRISRFCRLNILELKEAPLPKNSSPADEAEVMRKEGESILSHIGQRDYVIALEVEGEMMDSVRLSKKLRGILDSGPQAVDLIIGGSLGLSPEVKKRADLGLSFSPMTFPHQMMRVILLEQLYRSFKIDAGEAYHK